jgi:hypothetical protein
MKSKTAWRKSTGEGRERVNEAGEWGRGEGMETWQR